MRALLSLFALLPVSLLQAAEIPLYPTGPSEDSAFLRFFNAGDTALELSAENGASLRLEGDVRASDFLTVPAGKPIKGSLKQGEAQQALDISVAPGEFASVVGIATEQGLNLVTVREMPDDFNALKASLAFYSLDASCANAGLQAAGRNVDIFKDVAHGALQRRSINPLNLSVQLRCGGASVGEPLALGELAAGQRYTLFLVPSAEGPRLFQAQDNLAN
ncbi:cell division protein FtsQ [Pseudomonas sp. HMWF032]|uniref:alginate O-acetyltransferase AlgF n=1 Tax=unclassified Pseudomonas TaxID=196821 RepID=UPI000D3B646D|nr:MULTISPECIES: alginate O-acetyltransferase AlgF [unclassified Pseudomonas]PTS82687.1 cell division protein FtsQ [Pseudomonas sp. HMWF032]PTT82320.1 cell division protein FtsQ [Pseudomonas sp. HMWF010]WAC43550.1 alginate O-acetyltransferase AlgF [Pseudomonas sp. SL4(2022)]